MSSRNKPSRPFMLLRRAVILGTVAPSAMLLAGCNEYLVRQEPLTLGVGDSIEINKATQAYERWPAVARHDRWRSDGERYRRAVDHYRIRSIGDSKEIRPSQESQTTNSN